MTNFEYLIMLLEDDKDLVDSINNMETGCITGLADKVYEGVSVYYELFGEEN